MPTDPREESDGRVPPEGKPTVNLPAMTDRAILEEVARVGRETAATVNTMRRDVDTLLVDGRAINLRMAGVEGRIAKLESPTHPPPPLTSVRVREVVDERASQMNMEQDARIAALLVQKDEKIAKLEAESATKAEMKTMLEEAAKVQTEAIVAGVNTVMKTPTAQKLKGAIVPVLMIAISLIGLKLQASLTKLEERPAPPTVVQLAPVTVYADSGADQ